MKNVPDHLPRALSKLRRSDLEKWFLILQESYNDLMIRYKYTLLDLEATRREQAGEAKEKRGNHENP